MKKIMFNDKYGLTEAVLEGRKTQTRRMLNPTRFFKDWRPTKGGQMRTLVLGKGHVRHGSTKLKALNFSRCLITHCCFLVTR